MTTNDKLTPEKRIKALEERIQTLEFIVRETLWMVKRYADNQDTYAPGVYNKAVGIALELGMSIRRDPRGGTIWAKDRRFGWPTKLIAKYGMHNVEEWEGGEA